MNGRAGRLYSCVLRLCGPGSLPRTTTGAGQNPHTRAGRYLAGGRAAVSAHVSLSVRLAELRAQRDAAVRQADVEREARVRIADAAYEAAVVAAASEELHREIAPGGDPNRLIGEAAVRDLVGVSGTGFDRLRHDPRKGFPKPHRLVDSRPRWIYREVVDWNWRKSLAD